MIRDGAARFPAPAAEFTPDVIRGSGRAGPGPASRFLTRLAVALAIFSEFRYMETSSSATGRSLGPPRLFRITRVNRAACRNVSHSSRRDQLS